MRMLHAYVRQIAGDACGSLEDFTGKVSVLLLPLASNLTHAELSNNPSTFGKKTSRLPQRCRLAGLGPMAEMLVTCCRRYSCWLRLVTLCPCGLPIPATALHWPSRMETASPRPFNTTMSGLRWYGGRKVVVYSSCQHGVLSCMFPAMALLYFVISLPCAIFVSPLNARDVHAPFAATTWTARHVDMDTSDLYKVIKSASLDLEVRIKEGVLSPSQLRTLLVWGLFPAQLPLLDTGNIACLVDTFVHTA